MTSDVERLRNLFMTVYARLTRGESPSPARWVFSSVHNREFNYNSSYLFLYVKEHCPQIQPYYIMNDENKRHRLEQQYGKGYFIDTTTLAGIRQVLSCQVWITSTSPPLYGIGFRKTYRIINLWHGVPLKKIGMLQENLSWFVRRYYKYFFADNYEVVATTSRKLIPVMSRSFLVEPERVKVWGQPRNDMLYQPRDPKRDLEERLGEVPDFQKLILYAPTFRDGGGTRLFPFPEEGALAENLLQFLEDKQLMLCIRLHLYENTADTSDEWLISQDRPGSRIRFLNEDRAEDIMDILNIFDLLITDYSSIYIDYLLTGRPIVFLPYDKEEYLSSRGLNFDYDRVTPGPKPKTFREFLNCIEELLYNRDAYVQQRQRISRFFNEVTEPCCETICKNILTLCRQKKP